MNLRRVCAGLGAAVLMALVVACGGNASRVEPFRPTAMVVFGDESSLIVQGTSAVPESGTGKGLKYSINHIDQTAGSPTLNQVQCAAFPIWVQYVSGALGFDFEACQSTSGGLMRAAMRAEPFATLDKVEAQVATYRGSPGFHPKTMVTVSAGLWDLVAIFDRYKNNLINSSEAIVQAEAAGARLGRLINSITNSGNGGRVIYANLPNLSLTPWGAAMTNAADRTLLSDMSNAFNNGREGIGKGLLTVTNNGQWAGALFVDVVVGNMSPTTNNAFGLTNTTTAACLTSSAPPNCTNRGYATGALTDLQPGAIDTSNVNRYLWAGDRQLGPAAHAQIGVEAQRRVQYNPF